MNKREFFGVGVVGVGSLLLPRISEGGEGSVPSLPEFELTPETPVNRNHDAQACYLESLDLKNPNLRMIELTNNDPHWYSKFAMPFNPRYFGRVNGQWIELGV